ncbi:sensor histidine kinase [Nonomuraea turcica]|uniref:sensor histidine kinase n=1 Tax=Nonomuraea sp. G32 TaxID=3067274 RepID=UPI00273B30C1|nr:histidine kinase [Nonomuraea sp. G32]MDP4510385.1 histidine kinase [Nonomuraea sp. G32]
MALSPARLLAGFICVMCLLRVSFHLGEASAGPLTVASIIGVATLQLPISLPGRRRLSAVLFPLQAVLNYLPLLAEADSWRAGGSGFVAASALLVVHGPSAWLIFGLIAVAEGAIATALVLAPVYVYYAVVAPLTVGLMLYGLSRLADLLDRVQRERSELAARAGEVERLRLWGHVHRLVVSSVSAVERLARRAQRQGDVEAVQTAISRAVAVAREALDQVRSLPPAEAAIPVPPRDDDTRILRLATPILIVTHVLFIGQSLFNFAADETLDPGSGDVGYLALLPVTFGLQFWHLAALRTRNRPRGLAWTMTAQALTIYAPLVQGEASGLLVSGFFAGVVLLYIRAPLSWPLCVVICGLPAVEAWHAWGPIASTYRSFSTLSTALAVYGLTRLVALVTELKQTRAELVEVAALRERLKVGRDVHDLLGGGLTTIVLHGELTLRLLEADPSRAMGQLERVSQAARAALADTARLSTPDRRLSLAAEVDSARAVLESAGAAVRIDAAPVPGPVEPVLAVVLREAVTNVLRHSTPGECLIEIAVEDGRVRLRVANDGAAPDSDEPGTGLRSLRARLAAIGGELTTTRTGDRFELLARAPVDHEDLTPTR